MNRESNEQSDRLATEQLNTLPANLTNKLTTHVVGWYKLQDCHSLLGINVQH